MVLFVCFCIRNDDGTLKLFPSNYAKRFFCMNKHKNVDFFHKMRSFEVEAIEWKRSLNEAIVISLLHNDYFVVQLIVVEGCELSHGDLRLRSPEIFSKSTLENPSMYTALHI